MTDTSIVRRAAPAFLGVLAAVAVVFLLYVCVPGVRSLLAAAQNDVDARRVAAIPDAVRSPLVATEAVAPVVPKSDPATDLVSLPIEKKIVFLACGKPDDALLSRRLQSLVPQLEKKADVDAAEIERITLEMCINLYAAGIVTNPIEFLESVNREFIASPDALFVQSIADSYSDALKKGLYELDAMSMARAACSSKNSSWWLSLDPLAKKFGNGNPADQQRQMLSALRTLRRAGADVDVDALTQCLKSSDQSTFAKALSACTDRMKPSPSAGN